MITIRNPGRYFTGFLPSFDSYQCSLTADLIGNSSTRSYRAASELSFKPLLTLIAQDLTDLQGYIILGLWEYALILHPLADPYCAIARDSAWPTRTRKSFTYSGATLCQRTLDLAENWCTYGGSWKGGKRSRRRATYPSWFLH
jgi:hypothetical protein